MLSSALTYRWKSLFRFISSHTVSKLKTGFVGLPNVGKSTLFNAVTQGTVAKAANYPFCTIDPNYAIGEVPDARLDKLSKMFGCSHKTNNVLEFVDIAGLVKGSSKGLGLGNQFLSNIRQVDVIVHVIRHFSDTNIIHVDGEIDPIRDLEIIQTELCLADINSIDKMKTKKKFDVDLMDIIMSSLSSGMPVRSIMGGLSVEQLQVVQSLHLLTSKPILYALNILESDWLNWYKDSTTSNLNSFIVKMKESISKLLHDKNPFIIPVSAQYEFEITQLSSVEKIELIDDSLLKANIPHGVHSLLSCVYHDLIQATTFYTADVNCEGKAWALPTANTRADDAAAIIHSDFKDKFIKAQVISLEDVEGEVSRRFAKHKKHMSWDLLGKTEGELNGKRVIRSEGRDYLVKDGDLILFKIQK